MKDTVLSLKGESSHHNISFPTSKLPALVLKICYD